MRPRFYWWPFLALCALVGWMLLAPLMAAAQVGPTPVVGKWGIIARVTFNVNALGDTIVPMVGESPSYVLGGSNTGPGNSNYIWVGGCGGSYTTFQAALWTGPGATGTQLTATSTFASAGVSTFQQKASLLTAGVIYSRAAQPNLYWNVSVVQGGGTTCTLWLTGANLPP